MHHHHHNCNEHLALLNRNGDNNKLVQKATLASVIVVLSLILIKLVAYLLTGSQSIIAALADSVLDGGASIINFFAIKHALKPADQKHRFGYGKLEALAGLGQALFICVSGLFLLSESVERIMEPETLHQTGLGMMVMFLSIAITSGLVLYQRQVIQKANSLALEGDYLHHRMDLYVSIGIVICLFFNESFPRLDPIASACITVFILYSAFHIGKRSVHVLMDRELPDDTRKKIIEITKKNDAVVGIHDLRTRSAGWQTFIQLHIEVDPELTLKAAHVIADEVEMKLREEFSNAEILVHLDPIYSNVTNREEMEHKVMDNRVNKRGY